MAQFTALGFVWRFIFALVLILASYNPSTYSYYHWAKSSLSTITPLLALAGICLIIAWSIYLRATFRSLGPLGLALASLLVACIIWLFVDMGWIDLNNTSAFTWIIEIFLAGVLSIGMSWSHIRRRLSGQLDVDDVDQ